MRHSLVLFSPLLSILFRISDRSVVVVALYITQASAVVPCRIEFGARSSSVLFNDHRST